MKKFIIFYVMAFIFVVCTFSCNTTTAKKEAEENLRKEFVRDSLEQVKLEREKREKEIADSIRYAAHLQEVKNSICLTSYWLSGANSCGGRDIHFNFKNLNREKTIKYLDFSVSFYNAVGDKAYDEIRDYSTFNGRITGPVKPNGTNYNSNFFECAIYNYQAKKMVLNSIDIEYMDGSTLYIIGEELKMIKGYKN